MPEDDGFRRQLLKDSEATLRQVRGVLTGLADGEGLDARHIQGQIEDSSEHAGAVADLLVETHDEIRLIIDVLRRGRRRLASSVTTVSDNAMDVPVESETEVRVSADVVLGDVELRVQRLFHRFSLGLDLGETESRLAEASTAGSPG